MKKWTFSALVALLLTTQGAFGQSLSGGEGTNAANFPRVTAPAMMRDDHTAVEYEALHFWDHFPVEGYTQFSDNELQHTFVEFLAGVLKCSPTGATAAMGAMMEKMSTNLDCYWFFLELSEEGLYDPNSPLRDDLLFEAVLRHAIGAHSPLDETSQMRYRSLLRIVARNQEGSQAADFTYTLPNGHQTTLHKTLADLTLLYFYNPGCPECAHVKEVLVESGYAEALHNIGLLTVIALHPDEELDEWRATLGENPEWWISAYDKGTRILNNDTYDLKAIPTLYLLDGAKSVMLKDAPVEEVVQTLANIYNSLMN